MFNDIPVKFPRIFALMWFSQSKSAEADWAVNTSEAALDAWEEGIAKIASVHTKENFHPVISNTLAEKQNCLNIGRARLRR